MRIAILHYAAPPVVGGVESVIGHHARLMRQAGHSVSILAGRGAAVIPGVEFAEIPLLDSRHPEVLAVKAELDRGWVPAAFADLAARIRAILQERLQGFDLLIAHNVGSLHKNLPLTAALHTFSAGSGRTKVALWHHDLAWKAPRYRSELYAGLPWSLLKTAWPGVKRQVVISELRRRELAELMQMPPQEIRVVPNGVQIEELLKLELKTIELASRLDLFSGSPLLLQPVRITRRKNLELSLRLLGALKRLLPEARLLVTGPIGPHNPANRRYFDELIELREALGLHEAAYFLAEISDEFLPDSVIADFYRLADGLLLTSREEGFGIPLLEAGVAGLPIFCTDIPSLRELAGEEADFFSPDEDPEKIARLVYLRLKSEGVYLMRKKVRQFYRWEDIYRLHIAPLLKDLVDER